MKRRCLYALLLATVLFAPALTEARKKSKSTDSTSSDTTGDASKAEPPPAPLIQSGPGPAPLPAPGAASPGVMQPAAIPPPSPPPVVVTRRRYWELSAIGGGIVGGAYVLSVLAGAFSYAGYYQGQWGWFVPGVGPILSIANVDGGAPADCLSKAFYTYGIGSLLMIFTAGGIATAIAGAFVQKTVTVPASTPSSTPASAPPPGPELRLTPTAGPGSAGLILLGTF